MSAVRTNYVSNATFENGIAGWTTAIDAAGSLASSTAQVYAGTKSALLTNSSGANSNVCALFGASGTTIAATASAIPVLPGQRVDTTAMTRGLGFAGTVIATIYWMNAAGAQISTVSGSSVGASTTAWKPVRANGVAPANCTQFAVGVRAFATTPGTGVYFDTVIAEVATGSVVNTYDTYFDGSTVAAGYAYAWTGTPHASTSTETRLSRRNVVTNPSGELDVTDWPYLTNATRTLSTEQAHSGVQSFKLAVTNTTAAMSSNNFTVLPNRLYTFSAWVYCSRAISARIASSTSGYGASPVAVTPNVWTRISSVGYQLQGDASAQDLRVFLTGTQAGDIVYVDDILMEQGSDLLPYFDGSSIQSGYIYAWTGTPHASASTEVLTPTTVTFKEYSSGSFTSRVGVPKAWNGTAWVVRRPKRWNGSTWVNLL